MLSKTRFSSPPDFVLPRATLLWEKKREEAFLHYSTIFIPSNYLAADLNLRENENDSRKRISPKDR